MGQYANENVLAFWSHDTLPLGNPQHPSLADRTPWYLDYLPNADFPSKIKGGQSVTVGNRWMPYMNLQDKFSIEGGVYMGIVIRDAKFYYSNYKTLPDYYYDFGWDIFNKTPYINKNTKHFSIAWDKSIFNGRDIETGRYHQSMIALGRDMFANMVNLKTLYIIPMDKERSFAMVIPVIRWGAFQGCTNFERIYIASLPPDNEENAKNIRLKFLAIEEHAFSGCATLNQEFQIQVPSTYLGVYGDALYEHFKVQSDYGYIGAWAFNGCSSFDPSISLFNENGEHEYKGYIGKRAFSYTKASSLNFLNTTTIPQQCFEGCWNLGADESVQKLGENVTAIEAGAFQDCSNLYYIDLFKANTSDRDKGLTIGDWAFKNCFNLKGGPKRFYPDNKQILYLPEGLTSIGNYAFEGCTALTEVVLPKSLTSLGKGAFKGCINLTKITIKSNSGLSIGDNAFEYCKLSEGIIIDNNEKGIITSIGQASFKNTDLETININFKDEIIIGNEAFSNCPQLEDITITSKENNYNNKPQNIKIFGEFGEDVKNITTISLTNYTGPYWYLLQKDIVTSELETVTLLGKKSEELDLTDTKSLSSPSMLTSLTNLQTTNNISLKLNADFFDKCSNKLRFIGSAQEWEKILNDNPTIKNKSDYLFIGEQIAIADNSIKIDIMKGKTLFCLPTKINRFKIFPANSSLSVSKLFYYGKQLSSETQDQCQSELYNSITKLILNADIEEIGQYALTDLPSKRDTNIYQADSFKVLTLEDSYLQPHAFSNLKYIYSKSLCLEELKKSGQENNGMVSYFLQDNVEIWTLNNNSERKILLKYYTNEKTDFDLTNYHVFANQSIQYENNNSKPQISLTIPFVGAYRYGEDEQRSEKTILSWMIDSNVQHCLKHLTIDQSEPICLCGTEEKSVFSGVSLLSLVFNANRNLWENNTPIVSYDNTFDSTCFDTDATLTFQGYYRSIPERFLANTNILNQADITNIKILKIIYANSLNVTNNFIFDFKPECFQGLKQEKLILYLPKIIRFDLKKDGIKNGWLDFQNKIKIDELYYGGVNSEFNKIELRCVDDSPLQYTKTLYNNIAPQVYQQSDNELIIGRDNDFNSYAFYNNKIFNTMDISLISNDPKDALGPDNTIIELYGTKQEGVEFSGGFGELYRNCYREASESSELEVTI